MREPFHADYYCPKKIATSEVCMNISDATSQRPIPMSEALSITTSSSLPDTSEIEDANI